MKKLIHFTIGSLLAATIALPGAATAQQASETSEISAYASDKDAPAFDTAEAAVDALKAALAANDLESVSNLLGLDGAKLKSNEDVKLTFEQIREGAAKRVQVVDEAADRKVLEIGNKLWPLPFPLVKGSDGKWSYDTFAGLQEVIDRRIGENELQAIATMRAYVDAQEKYAEDDHDGDGVLEFAQKLISSEGMTDGLYWPSDQGDGESPAGAGISADELDDAKKGEGYFGYRFKPLLAQGDNIAGGRYDYVINGNMIAGFALLAWPVRYGETGINVFAVNQHGTVYEIDLGPATDKIVKYIDRFDPDESWQVVND
ncbi:MAG: DUF2950 domain-containing protein [Rhizobiaceae bacterium]|nr:DUF2950 domain-containing protein [Rhizobiaceae bacterium]